MKKINAILIFLFTLWCVVSPVSLLAEDTSSHASPSGAQELNMSLSGEPIALDFSFSRSSSEIDVYNYLMEGLTRNNDNGKAIPGIAASWTISEDGRVWTFNLRDAKWEDGEAVTAQQFKDGWLRALNPLNPSPYSYLLFDILNSEDYAKEIQPSESVGITVVDARTLRVTLKEPVTYFDALVSMPVFSPLRTDLLAADGTCNSDFAKMIVNGPFRLSSWDSGKTMVFEKNPTYWNQSAIFLTKVTGYIFNDITYMDKIDMYENGTLDLIDYVDSTSIKTVGKSNIKNYMDGSVWFLSFNCSDKTLKNANLRKALTYSIDRNQYLNAAFPGRKYIYATSLVAPDVIPDALKGTFRENSAVLFKNNDISSAKEFLQLAYSELNVEKLPPLTLLVNKTILGIAGGDALSSMWKKNLGITVKVKAVSQEERLRSLVKSKYQITLDGWGPDYPDPMTYLDIFTPKNPMNNTNYSSEAYGQLIASAKASSIKSEKFELMHQAEALLMKDMPICPLFFRKGNYCVKRYVKNIKGDAFAPYINFIYSYIEH